jgi:O-antigen/teichoic acid export membrane protein
VKTQLVALGRQTLIYGLGNVAVQAVGLLTLPVFARVFSQAECGVLELATVTPAAVAILADVRLASGSQRSWFEYRDEQHRPVTMTGLRWVARSSRWGPSIFIRSGWRYS